MGETLIVQKSRSLRYIIRLSQYIQHARILIQFFLNKFITIICNIAQLLLFLTYVLCFILHLPYPGLLTLLPYFIFLFTLISDASFLKWHCISLHINLSHVARHLAQYTPQNGFTHILVISFRLYFLVLFRFIMPWHVRISFQGLATSISSPFVLYFFCSWHNEIGLSVCDIQCPVFSNQNYFLGSFSFASWCTCSNPTSRFPQEIKYSSLIRCFIFLLTKYGGIADVTFVRSYIFLVSQIATHKLKLKR